MIRNNELPAPVVQERNKHSNEPTPVIIERIVTTPSEKPAAAKQQLPGRNERVALRNDKNSGNDKLSYREITSPEFSSFKPLIDAKSPEAESPENSGMGKRPDLLSRVCKYTIDYI